VRSGVAGREGRVSFGDGRDGRNNENRLPSLGGPISGLDRRRYPTMSRESQHIISNLTLFAVPFGIVCVPVTCRFSENTQHSRDCHFVDSVYPRWLHTAIANKSFETWRNASLPAPSHGLMSCSLSLTSQAITFDL
jgi:hypothetical protein